MLLPYSGLQTVVQYNILNLAACTVRNESPEAAEPVWTPVLSAVPVYGSFHEETISVVFSKPTAVSTQKQFL